MIINLKQIKYLSLCESLGHCSIKPACNMTQSILIMLHKHHFLLEKA